MELTLRGYLDSLLMGVVISQMFTYWQFVKTDRKHIVGAVVSPDHSKDPTGD